MRGSAFRAKGKERSRERCREGRDAPLWDDYFYVGDGASGDDPEPDRTKVLSVTEVHPSGDRQIVSVISRQSHSAFRTDIDGHYAPLYEPLVTCARNDCDLEVASGCGYCPFHEMQYIYETPSHWLIPLDADGHWDGYFQDAPDPRVRDEREIANDEWIAANNPVDLMNPSYAFRTTKYESVIDAAIRGRGVEVPLPADQDPKTYLNRLRARLIADKRTMHGRWSVTITHNIVRIKRIGSWGPDGRKSA